MGIHYGPVVWGGDKAVCLACGRVLTHSIDYDNQRIVVEHDIQGCGNDNKKFAVPLQRMVEVES